VDEVVVAEAGLLFLIDDAVQKARQSTQTSRGLYKAHAQHRVNSLLLASVEEYDILVDVVLYS